MINQNSSIISEKCENENEINIMKNRKATKSYFDAVKQYLVA